MADKHKPAESLVSHEENTCFTATEDGGISETSL